jgi:hypothetical protein
MPRPLNVSLPMGFKSLSGMGFAPVTDPGSAIVASDCAATDTVCQAMAASNQATLAAYNSPINWVSKNWPWLVGGAVVGMLLFRGNR